MNINITLDLPPAVIGVLIVWAVIFLLSLSSVLRREDLDSVTRLTWVIVMLLVPIFGIVLYWLQAPQPGLPPQSPESEVFGTPWADDPGHTSSDSKV
jgi:phage shock protein PspC (stress-responsive transcriptional regulator)